jgi:hypothetical protein
MQPVCRTRGEERLHPAFTLRGRGRRQFQICQTCAPLFPEIRSFSANDGRSGISVSEINHVARPPLPNYENKEVD